MKKQKRGRTKNGPPVWVDPEPPKDFEFKPWPLPLKTRNKKRSAPKKKKHQKRTDKPSSR